MAYKQTKKKKMKHTKKIKQIDKTKKAVNEGMVDMARGYYGI